MNERDTRTELNSILLNWVCERTVLQAWKSVLVWNVTPDSTDAAAVVHFNSPSQNTTQTALQQFQDIKQSPD